MKNELVTLQRLVQRSLECESFRRLSRQERRAELVAVSSRLFGLVQSTVGVLQQRLRIAAVLRVEGDADAGGDVEFMVIDGDRLGDRPKDLARHCRHVSDVRRSRDQQRELVVAHASHRVFLAHARVQTLGDFSQKMISTFSAERFVDDVETIEVEAQHRQLAAGTMCVVERDGETVFEQCAIRQSREDVVVRLVPDLFLGALAIGDVDQRRRDDRMALAITHHAGIHQDPHLCAVEATQCGLEAGQRSLIAQPGDHRLPLDVRAVQLRDSVSHQLRSGGKAEHPRASVVAVEDSTSGVGSVLAGGVAIEQLLESLGRRADHLDAGAMSCAHGTDDQDDGKRHEPRSLIEECALPEYRRARAPRTIITCGAHLEAIGARLQVRV